MTARTPAWALVLSLLGPLVVACLALWLVRPPAGRPETTVVAQSLEDELAALEPELVLLGNSLLGMDVDERALADELGAPVASVWSVGTRPPNWYVVLKNRVFGSGLRPKAVVVATVPQMLVQNRPFREVALKALDDHMGAYEPVVDRKTFGIKIAEHRLLHELQVGRARVQEGLVRGVRELTVGLIFGRGDQGVRERGRALAEPALGRVFGADEAINLELHSRVIPIVEMRPEEPGSEAVARSIDATYVPDLVELVHEHGSKLLFVRLPVSSARDLGAGFADPQQEADFIELCRLSGAGYLDMNASGFPDAHFRDGVHMNLTGRRRFTQELGEALRDMDLLGDSPMPAPKRPQTRSVAWTRQGEPPAITSKGAERSPRGECLYRLRVRSLQSLGNRPLRDMGLPRVSPLVVRLDDGALQRNGFLAPLLRGCAGGFAHNAAAIYISPQEEESLDKLDPARLGLSLEEGPVRTDGAELWWVYPGTALVAELEPSPTGRGPVWMELILAVPLAGGRPAEVWVAGELVSLEPDGDRLIARVQLPPQAPGARSIEIRSPEDGPWLVVESLDVGIEDD